MYSSITVNCSFGNLARLYVLPHLSLHESPLPPRRSFPLETSSIALYHKLLVHMHVQAVTIVAQLVIQQVTIHRGRFMKQLLVEFRVFK